MRLWHKNMIPVLPREQLIAQWRECSAIASNIQTKGNPNHILVNRIMNYPLDHFISYAAIVRSEITRRGYKTMDKVWNKIINVKSDYNIISIEKIYPQWMNNEYLTICYYNLKEKWICSGIKDNDWFLIEKLYKEIVNIG